MQDVISVREYRAVNGNREPEMEAYDVTGGETKAEASSFYGRSFLCTGPHKCEKLSVRVTEELILTCDKVCR